VAFYLYNAPKQPNPGHGKKGPVAFLFLYPSLPEEGCTKKDEKMTQAIIVNDEFKKFRKPGQRC
jgi:hypothetical protein